MKQPIVYMMANKKNGVIYVGVSSWLAKRAYEHRNSVVNGFTKEYHCHLLVYYELHQTMESAITQRKTTKSGA